MGEVSFNAFLVASADHLRNIRGVASVAELDGDEIGFLVGKVGERLTAVILGSELLFRSFHRTNQFLDLTSYFREATDAEIKSLLGHATFCKSDADAILAKCNRPAMRRKFSTILHSKILDHPLATPDRIRTRAKKFGITLQVRVIDGAKRLVFPDDAAEAARLLQYLAEELYFSDLTEQPFETNSHRPLPVQATAPDS